MSCEIRFVVSHGLGVGRNLENPVAELNHKGLVRYLLIVSNGEGGGTIRRLGSLSLQMLHKRQLQRVRLRRDALAGQATF